MDTCDNFVMFGTALDPIEEEELTRKKPITISEQIATDEKGRRRFHGAFTGGFSAGYFNTVGSKEGWTPSSFKSSRSERYEAKTQDAMDFMDEEDMGAFGIAPQVLRPTDQFASTDSRSNRKRSKPTPSDGPIPGTPVLHQIIEPVKETVGGKILMKMGWKPGQGVGPRITRKIKDVRSKRSKRTDTLDDRSLRTEIELTSEKVYGCQLPPHLANTIGSDSDSSDELDQNVLFAPDDVDFLLCNPKENTFGLGYKALERMSDSVGHIDLFGQPLKFRMENKKLNVTGEAFGIGAFEDPDEDVYSREDMSSYDFELETAEERKIRKAKEALEKAKKKRNNGCIDGFVFSKAAPIKRKYFPPPSIPKNFQPFHKSKKSRFQATQTSNTDESKKRGLGRHTLNVQERQVLLGEENTEANKTLPSVAPNKTDLPLSSLNSAKDPDPDIEARVERIKKFVQVVQMHSRYEDSSSGSESKPAFKPFMKNPEKQDRYEKYLTLVSSGFQECLKDLQPPEMSNWEKEREKLEFERAADIYKPLSGVMSSRFVSAQSHDISHIVPEKEKLLEKDPTEDPKVAAKMNLFGKLTHTVVEWHPDKVLCKRFNIKDPFPDSKFVGLRNQLSRLEPKKEAQPTSELSVSNTSSDSKPPQPKKCLFDNLDFSKPPPGLMSNVVTTGEVGSIRNDQDEKGSELEFSRSLKLNESKIQAEKPPMDLFKEIFAESSDEEEDQEQEAQTIQENSPVTNDTALINDRSRQLRQTDVKSTTENPIETTKKSLDDGAENPRISSFPSSSKRIFDNLDFSKLENGSKSAKRDTIIQRTLAQESGSSEDEFEYGPKLPSNNAYPVQSSVLNKMNSSAQRDISSTLNAAIVSSDTSDLVWVEKERDSKGASKRHSKKSKKSKNKEKQKKAKKKKTKKSKHKSRHSTSDSGSDSEDSDASIKIYKSMNPKTLLKKLKKTVT